MSQRAISIIIDAEETTCGECEHLERGTCELFDEDLVECDGSSESQLWADREFLRCDDCLESEESKEADNGE